MNIIDEREKRTIYRKFRKKQYDDAMNLSVTDGPTVRLLDEGAVVYANGDIDFYIMKGTLERFYMSLPEEYEGSINLGHMDFPTFPILLGKWRKSDLRLVDIGDGRKGLDVNLHLDESISLVQDLKKMPYDLGVSAEFTYHINEDASETYGFLIIDEVNIRDFAIVGECGNVNSSGITLKGGSTVNLKELTAALDSAQSADIDAVNALLDEALEGSTDETVEEAVSEPETVEEPEAEPEAEPETEPETEEVEEEAEEEAEETEEAPEAEESEEQAEEAEMDLASEMSEQLAAVMTEVETLRAENAQLKATLAAKDESWKKFSEKFRKLSVVLTDKTETPKPITASPYTDGIGE